MIGHSLSYCESWITCMPQFEMNATYGSWAIGHSLRQGKMWLFGRVISFGVNVIVWVIANNGIYLYGTVWNEHNLWLICHWLQFVLMQNMTFLPRISTRTNAAKHANPHWELRSTASSMTAFNLFGLLFRIFHLVNQSLKLASTRINQLILKVCRGRQPRAEGCVTKCTISIIGLKSQSQPWCFTYLICHFRLHGNYHCKSLNSREEDEPFPCHLTFGVSSTDQK